MTSLESVLGLGYSGSSPFAGGMVAADFRAQHEAHGEPFRYFEARLAAGGESGGNRDGKVYGEVVLSAGARGMFYQTSAGFESEKFGVVAKGSTMFSCLPDVVEISDGGKLLRTAQSWPATARVKRGSGDFDALPERFLAGAAVYLDGVLVPDEHVAVVSADGVGDEERGGVRWLSGAPSLGHEYVVKYAFFSLFVCLGEEVQGSPLGVDGERLPQRVLLRKER